MKISKALFIVLIFISSQVFSQNLPDQASNSLFRIQIQAVSINSLSNAKNSAKQISEFLLLNSYLIKKDLWYKILVGDYKSKEQAKRELFMIREQYPKAWIAPADNDKVIVYYESKQKQKKYSQPATNNTKPKKQNSYNKQNNNVVENNKEINENLFSSWNNPKYKSAHTASDVDYLTEEEKNVFYYLNLARMNPKLFADTYLVQKVGRLKTSYQKSLYKELIKLKSLSPLSPDRELWISAKCHAIESGKSGYVGHKRKNCKSQYYGECCSYGHSDGLDIVIKLLIDENVPSLGHRKICLGNYSKLGVSIKPHKRYGENAVLDFSY